MTYMAKAKKAHIFRLIFTKSGGFCNLLKLCEFISKFNKNIKVCMAVYGIKYHL